MHLLPDRLPALPHLRVRAIHEVIATNNEPLRVTAEDQQPYILKYGRQHRYELQAEWICHWLLRLWGLPTPDVAVLEVPEAVRDSEVVPARIGRWLDQPAFGSRLIRGAADSNNELLGSAAATGALPLANPDDLLWLALFDAWVVNSDRNPRHHNLLLTAAKTNQWNVWAIDHAFAFDSTSFLTLDPTYTYFSYNDNLIDSAVGRLVATHWRARHGLLWEEAVKSGFRERVARSAQHFAHLCTLLPAPYYLSEAEQTSLHELLFDQNRLQLLQTEFVDCLR